MYFLKLVLLLFHNSVDTLKPQITHFKLVYYMVCELYLNEDVLGNLHSSSFLDLHFNCGGVA